MLATVTKINLPSCLGFCFQICPFYVMAPRPRMHPIFETFCRMRRFTQRKEKTKGIGYLRDL